MQNKLLVAPLATHKFFISIFFFFFFVNGHPCTHVTPQKMQLPWKSQISDCIGQMLGMLLLLVTAGTQLGKLTAWGGNAAKNGRKMGGKTEEAGAAGNHYVCG